MSVQLHAPTPNQYPASPTPMSARRHSSQLAAGGAIERPPSRSERLLRDTLRRDELQAARPPLVHASTHHISSPTSPRNHSRRPSYTPSCNEDSCDDGELGMGLFRPAAAGLQRNRSLGHVPRRASTSYMQSHPHQHQSQHQSPAQQYAQLHTAHPPRRREHSPGPSPQSPPSSARSRAHSHSYSPPTSALTPHEAVLRARLEKVLSMGRDLHHAHHAQYSHARSQSSSSPEEWASDDISEGSSGSSPPTSGGHTPPLTHTSSSHTHMSAPKPRRRNSPPTPLTPPDSPHFDARAAGAVCRQMEGYVSFAHVEGLGGIDPDSSEDEGLRHGAGGIKGGLERLWRVWGREREGKA
ncbi:hypothetical protein HWV62_17766 [Athelia sp. TMB]|nr:hypothetical protein HWV62_17766 [Athelia sp. TMB]